MSGIELYTMWCEYCMDCEENAKKKCPMKSGLSGLPNLSNRFKVVKCLRLVDTLPL